MLLEPPLGLLLATLGELWSLLGVLGISTGTPGKAILTIWDAEGVIFHDFLRFYQAKVQFA